MHKDGSISENGFCRKPTLSPPNKRHENIEISCGWQQEKAILSNHHPMRNHAVLGNDDDAIADEIIGVVHFVELACRRDDGVVPDAGGFVHDGVLDAAVGAN